MGNLGACERAQTKSMKEMKETMKFVVQFTVVANETACPLTEGGNISVRISHAIVPKLIS